MFGSLSDFNGSLFEDFRRMQRDMDQMFGARAWPAGIRAVSRGTFPPINMGTTQDKVDIYLYAAGVDSKSLDISIQRNLLTVAGERKVPVAEKGNYYRQERFSGDFRRVITLPDDVDPDQVNAGYQNGVLHITIQRQVAAGPRQIEVK